MFAVCVSRGQTPTPLPPADADRAPAAVTSASLSYRAYALQHAGAEAARDQLVELLRGTPGVEVVADAPQRRLLVRGDAQTHQLVAQLVLKIDLPAGTLVAPAGAGEAKMEAYKLDDTTREVLMAWQRQSAGRPEIRVAIDERTSQALVFAPPVVHAQIQQQLGARSVAASPESPGLTAPAGPVVLQLRHLPPAELHARFERLLSRQLPATNDVSGQWQSFAVEASPGVAVSINVNMQSGQVRVEGPPLQVAAWRQVVEALDSPPPNAGQVTQIVRTQPANHERVRKALAVLQTDSAERSRPNDSLVAMLFQQQEGAAAPATPPPAQPPQNAAQDQPAAGVLSPEKAQTAEQAARLAEAAGGLLGPVKVEYVEGLDAIILRGNERDVQRVLEIINQIEQLSTVTVPDIQIYELKSVDSVTLGAMLQRLYELVLGPRIGTVTITPLGKPNALLLIGRPENVKMAIELIQRLDQPVNPLSRFEVFPLKHAAATETKALIDEFLGQGENQQQQQPAPPPGATPGEQIPTLEPRALVVADPRTNSLIISASPRDMAEVAALIARIDTPGAAAELKVFTIVNGDAETLAQMLRSLFSVSAEPQADAATGGGLAAGGGPVRMQFSVDPRTNSIIAAGTREDLAVVEAILLRLDEGDLRERITSVHRLNNAFAQNVAFALQQWLQTERQAEAQADLAISPFEQIEREVIVVPELATNSLIVSATPRFYKEVLKVISDLDERPPMVLIQVLIAQVQLNDTDQFGVELGLQDSVLFDRSLLVDPQFQNTTQTLLNGTTIESQTVLSATGQPGFNWNTPQAQPLGNNLSTAALATAGRVGAQSLSNFAVNRVDPALGFSGFVFSASSDAVSVLLRALQEKRRLEVLSRPQIMALDGQQGSVQVGQDVPTIQGVSLTQFGQTNNIVYRSVGLILQVIPRISPDGLVVMQILANKSQVSNDPGIPISIATGGQVVTAPRIDVSQALTTVSAVSGQTVVLGALIETGKNDVHRRVPIIADIPLIGDLFRYDSVSEERRELLIILTPQIIYTKMDSDLTKQIESSRMSWCLSDVINMHGEAGLRSRCDEWYDGEMESVFPNPVPEEGLLPLSKEHVAPGVDGSIMESPNCLPVDDSGMPNGLELQSAPRLSPTTQRPVNDRYGLGDISTGVTQASAAEPAEAATPQVISPPGANLPRDR
jgi:type II secretion system protein D